MSKLVTAAKGFHAFAGLAAVCVHLVLQSAIASERSLVPNGACLIGYDEQRGIDISNFPRGQRALYEFETPGFHFLAEFERLDQPGFEIKLKRFMLDYDPKSISHSSPYRAVLGDLPMQYRESDLRYFGRAFIADYGFSLTF